MDIQNLNDYQTTARKTAMGGSIDHFMFGLVEEAGEAAGILKRFHRGDEGYGKGQLSTIAREKLIKELGDVLWYIAMVADLCEVQLSEVANINITKLADRKARNVITGSGDNR